MGNYLNKLYNTHCLIEENFELLLSFYYVNNFRKSDYYVLHHFISLILIKLQHENIPYIRFLLKYRLLYLLLKKTRSYIYCYKYVLSNNSKEMINISAFTILRNQFMNPIISYLYTL